MEKIEYLEKKLDIAMRCFNQSLEIIANGAGTYESTALYNLNSAYDDALIELENKYSDQSKASGAELANKVFPKNLE